MLQSISAPPIPLWKINIGKASISHTERRRTNKEGREVVFFAVLAVEEHKLQFFFYYPCSLALVYSILIKNLAIFSFSVPASSFCRYHSKFSC
jgi:hypothetical protein